ncbi:MAG: hypothetical protein ABH834_00790 [Candidatus Altiarchaeota archaeon]
MSVHRRKSSSAQAGADEASALTNPAIPLLDQLVKIRDPSEQAARVADYTDYVSARYGEGLDDAIHAGGRRYRAITGPVSRQFKRGTGAPNPFTPLTCLLAQSSDIDVDVVTTSYHAYQERFTARREEWNRLGIMRGQNISVQQGSMAEKLMACPNAHFDEITCRFPSGSPKELAPLLAEKLNIEGSLNPNGASVLIGMKYSSGVELAAEFDRVIQKRVEGLEGFELKTSLHNVGGAGSPAKLWQIVKKQT